jgi:hypothetical protein
LQSSLYCLYYLIFFGHLLKKCVEIFTGFCPCKKKDAAHLRHGAASLKKQLFDWSVTNSAKQNRHAAVPYSCVFWGLLLPGRSPIFTRLQWAEADGASPIPAESLNRMHTPCLP